MRLPIAEYLRGEWPRVLAIAFVFAYVAIAIGYELGRAEMLRAAWIAGREGRLGDE